MDGYYFSRGSFFCGESIKRREEEPKSQQFDWCLCVWKCMFSANPLEPDTPFLLVK